MSAAAAGEPLVRVEELYREVLELSARQEQALRAGDAGALPAILAAKADMLLEAQTLMAAVSERVDRADPSFQGAVRAIGAVLTDLVAAEERLRVYAPAPGQAPPPRRVLAAYARR